MTSSMRSHAPEERNTTEPASGEPTIPNESGDHPIITESAIPSESMYGTIINEPLDTPAAPFFTERPARLSDSPDEAPDSGAHTSGSHRLKIEELALRAIASRVAFVSGPPETAAEYRAPVKPLVLTDAPAPASTTIPDELPPEHKI